MTKIPSIHCDKCQITRDRLNTKPCVGQYVMKHSQHRPTDAELTPSVLAMVASREGASDLMQAVLLTDAPQGARHLARSKVRAAIQRDGLLPGAWGHFMTALWQGDERGAWSRADGTNVRILEQAKGIDL